MRARLRFAGVGLAALLAAQAALAEPTGRYFYVAPFGGHTIFDGDLRFPDDLQLRDRFNLGARLGWQYDERWALEVAGGVTPTREDVEEGSEVNFKHLSGNIVFSPWTGRIGGPFLFVGGGAAQLSGEEPLGPELAGLVGEGDTFNMGTLDFGAGLKFWLTDLLGVRFEARAMRWIPKSEVDLDLTHMVLGGSVVWAIGATPRDTDLDGVPDRRDRCPNTPRGAVVDASGCPVDTDRDSVFDGLDKCPDTPAGCRVDAGGCPVDSDGDGVCDGVDACEGTPKGAVVDARGCPVDADHDGVPDGLDQCANTPAGMQVDERGCPVDADQDGVTDDKDKCPGTAAGLKVDAEGCPIEVIERETELMDTGMIRLQDIHFETAKWEVLAEEMPRLDVVGQVLTRWPELRIEIGGHTDARGSTAYNQDLSQKRAQSVLSYLLGKFPDLKPGQYTARGYGEGRPIAPNNGEPNWSKNRRVEFKVLNRDVLRREVQRRRLLQKSEPTPAAPEPTPTVPDTGTTPSRPDTLTTPGLPDTLTAPAAPDTTR